MAARTPTDTIQTFFDALNARDVERAVRLVAPSYRGRDVTRSSLTRGREQARREIRAGMRAFSDLTFSLPACVADAPHVSVRWEMEARHDGSFLHVPATGRDVSVSGMGFFTVRDAQIVRAVHLWDFAGLLRTCGLLPNLPGDADPSAAPGEGDTSG